MGGGFAAGKSRRNAENTNKVDWLFEAKYRLSFYPAHEVVPQVAVSGSSVFTSRIKFPDKLYLIKSFLFHTPDICIEMI